METQGIQNRKKNREKEQFEIHNFQFQNYKLTITKTVLYYHEDRNIDQIRFKLKSRNKPCLWSTDFQQGWQSLFNRKNSLLNKWCWDNWINNTPYEKLT